MDEIGNEIKQTLDELQECVVQSLNKWLRRRKNRKKFYKVIDQLYAAILRLSNYLSKKEESDVNEEDLLQSLVEYDILQAHALISLLSRNLVCNLSLPNNEPIINLSFLLDELVEQHHDLVRQLKEGKATQIHKPWIIRLLSKLGAYE